MGTCAPGALQQWNAGQAGSGDAGMLSCMRCTAASGGNPLLHPVATHCCIRWQPLPSANHHHLGGADGKALGATETAVSWIVFEALRACVLCVGNMHAPFTAGAAMPTAMITRSCGCASLRRGNGPKVVGYGQGETPRSSNRCTVQASPQSLFSGGLTCKAGSKALRGHFGPLGLCCPSPPRRFRHLVHPPRQLPRSCPDYIYCLFV